MNPRNQGSSPHCRPRSPSSNNKNQILTKNQTGKEFTDVPVRGQDPGFIDFHLLPWAYYVVLRVLFPDSLHRRRQFHYSSNSIRENGNPSCHVITRDPPWTTNQSGESNPTISTSSEPKLKLTNPSIISESLIQKSPVFLRIRNFCDKFYSKYPKKGENKKRSKLTAV